MTGPDIQAGSSDVAMFIDWENMHGFIRGKANISALREVEGDQAFACGVVHRQGVDHRSRPVGLTQHLVKPGAPLLRLCNLPAALRPPPPPASDPGNVLTLRLLCKLNSFVSLVSFRIL